MTETPPGLALRFEPDTDGSGELFASVCCGAFAGVGSAWFGVRQLDDFGRRLRDGFPLAPDAELVLEGGYWRSGAQPPVLDEVLLGLRIRSVGHNGRIGVRVALMQGRAEGEDPLGRARLHVELRTEYQALHEFGSALLDLAQGRADSVLLRHLG